VFTANFIEIQSSQASKSVEKTEFLPFLISRLNICLVTESELGAALSAHVLGPENF
jgi:hypothetical protein